MSTHLSAQLENALLYESDFITQCVERVKIMFDINEQQLKIEVSNTLPIIQGNREKLEQVVFNLLSNANKYSPQASEIVIKAICNKNAIVIEVEDEAPLVTDDEKDKIFKPYYRGEDAEERRQHPGLGLGLAISKKIIDSHNGEMWVRNKSNGNIFCFSLPVLDIDDLPYINCSIPCNSRYSHVTHFSEVFSLAPFKINSD